MGPETLDACYTTLGLTPDAKFSEIKHAYRTLVKRWHPDRFGTDANQQRQALERFHAITHLPQTSHAGTEAGGASVCVPCLGLVKAPGGLA
jgi:DnaJ-domain-containing protein 1